MKAAEPIRNSQQIKAMCDYFLSRQQTRNYALLMTGIHTALRISDLLRLHWKDVYDYERKQMRSSFTITEQKTHKTKTVALHKIAATALQTHFTHSDCPHGEIPLFESNRERGKAISRIQAYRIIREAAAAAELEGTISCHSMRKTFGYHAWKNRVPLAVIMEIYNHSSFVITRRYLGITQDDKDSAYLNLQFS